MSMNANIEVLQMQKAAVLLSELSLKTISDNCSVVHETSEVC